ncbi:MAG TPA: DUF6585 family protein [Anaerolineales bacterium]|nr:DUF6585 family protein [Anaerolineales bacterium]
MPDQAQSLNCPACGAALAPQPGQISLQCPYCKSTVKIPEAFLAGEKQKKQKGSDGKEDKPAEDPLIAFLEGQAKRDRSWAFPRSQAHQEQSPHAWGVAQPAAGPAVPAGFEAVTTLGPLVVVCDPRHTRLNSPRISRLVVYQDGFACQAGGAEMHAWRFSEMAAICSDEQDYANFRHKKYTLFRANGESLVLDVGIDTWKNEPDTLFLDKLQTARDYLKIGMYRQLLPSALQRYEAGEELTFGKLAVQKTGGLRIAGSLYAWNHVQDVHLQSGQFEVTLNFNQQILTKIRISEIPNIELLCRLIGVKLMELEYGMMYV